MEFVTATWFLVHSRNPLECWLQGKLLIWVTPSRCSRISWTALSFSRGVGILNQAYFPIDFVSVDISKVIPRYSMNFPPFSKDLQVEFGPFLKFPECLVGKRWEKVLPDGFGAGKAWIFLGVLPCPELSYIPASMTFPPWNFPWIFLSWAQSRSSSTSRFNSSSSPQSLVRNNELQGLGNGTGRGRGSSFRGLFPKLLLLAAIQANSRGFGICRGFYFPLISRDFH